MSLITGDPEDSPRDCSRSSSRPPPHKHHHHHHRHGNRRRALVAVSSTVASLLSLALILWLTLRPSSPSFSLLAATATVASANASATMITVDAALTAHNPNAHATALYDQLQATASYAGVPLGGAAPLMPTPLQQPEGDVVLSAMLTSSSSSSSAWTTWRSPPAEPERALLRVRIQGQLRWKVAAWVSATHGLTVDCIAAVLLQAPAAAIPLPPGQLQLQQQGSSQCATHVQ